MLAAVAFMAQLDLFIVNVAVPADGAVVSRRPACQDLSWVLNGYAIVFGALLVPAGRLADHFGRRRFLLGGVVVFTAGSVLCAVAPVADVLVPAASSRRPAPPASCRPRWGCCCPTFPARQHNPGGGRLGGRCRRRRLVGGAARRSTG